MLRGGTKGKGIIFLRLMENVILAPEHSFFPNLGLLGKENSE